MTYEINGNLLEVTNEIRKYDKLIYGRFSQFEENNNGYAKNYIKFKKNSVDIYAKGKYKFIKNKIIKTDIYPIINNLISYLINDDNNAFIHGITISNKVTNKGFLIVGDFGQGKTTLSDEFEKEGYEINSTDQTWLEIRNNSIYQKLGSSFDIKNDNVLFLDKNKIKKEIKIERIIRIVGLCDNGDVSFKENKNKFHIIKNLSYFCNWNYIMPIFTDDVELFNSTKNVKKFMNKLAKTETMLFDVRGDRQNIVKKWRI